MPKASRLFRRGEWNICTFEVDCKTGTATVRIFRHGWRKPAQFRVKNFGKKNEKIIEDEEVSI